MKRGHGQRVQGRARRVVARLEAAPVPPLVAVARDVMNAWRALVEWLSG